MRVRLGLVALLALLLALLTCGPSSETAKVARVIDGDTIVIEGGDYVRYIGIDAPEKDEPYYDEAWQANRELVEGKVVRLEKDVSDRDRYGRLLRYVYVDGSFVNAELVARGYAQAKAYPPDLKYQDQLEELERQARQAGLGMWRR